MLKGKAAWFRAVSTGEVVGIPSDRTVSWAMRAGSGPTQPTRISADMADKVSTDTAADLWHIVNWAQTRNSKRVFYLADATGREFVRIIAIPAER